MLRDSASWPTINLPGNPNPSYPQQNMGYPGDVISHMNRSQQQAYMQQQQAQAAQRGIGPSPAKRPRHIPPGHAHGSATAIPAPVIAPDPALEDEDGTSGGDYMDFLTPRDISMHRYVQHHEWLEEILNSSFDTSQIIPGELGLGRKGELESLTKDFFNAPIDATPKEAFPLPESSPELASSQVPIPDTATPRVGRLEAGKAEDFTRRATERIEAINAEMEKLKRQHARRMAKLNKGGAFKEGAEDLRGHTLDMINGDASKAEAEQYKIDELVSKLEAHTGKALTAVPDVECIQQGGLEEKSQAKDANDQDYDMVDTFGQFDGHTPQAPNFSETPIPDFTQPTSASNDASDIPQNHEVLPQPGIQVDNHVDGVTQPAEPKDTTAEEWIMVNKEGSSAAEEDQDLGELATFANDAAMQPNMDNSNVNDAAGIDDIQGFDQDEGEDNTGHFDSNDFGEGIDFGDLDTAGDELAGYAQEIESAGLQDQNDMGASDTAFGEAFQDPEATVADDQTPAA